MSNAYRKTRFGTVAVDMEFVTMEQVINALEIQVKENISLGTHRRIGMILFEQGHLTLLKINKVLQGVEDRRIGKNN